MSIRYEKNTTVAWYKRQVEKHKTVTSDALWARIRSSWPGLTEEEHEEIFQACGHVKT